MSDEALDAVDEALRRAKEWQPTSGPDPLEKHRAAIQAEIDERAKTVGALVINAAIAIKEHTDRCVALTATLQALQPTQGAK